MSAGKRTVAVAMSGGVDSSVAAALLSRMPEYRVIGVFLRLPGGDSAESHGERDARRVAQELGVPFYFFDVSREFEELVIRDFVAQYTCGNTPNPCALCNRTIKFGYLLRRARELGADYLATGHYARVDYDTTPGRYLLLRGVDRSKDQSYFLYGLSQEQLAHAIFPLGKYTKEEVRRLAAGFGLPVAHKEESQDICFLRGRSYQEFLRHRAPQAFEPGPILDTSGRKLGTHRGIACYTIGQRRGLGVASDKPLYVLEIDAVANAVIVGSKEEGRCRCFLCGEVNLIAWKSIADEEPVTVQIRYRAKPASATISPSGCEQVLTHLQRPLSGVTPGQRAVWYQGDLVIGGGTILREKPPDG